jgi:hypothetical protein
MTTPEPKKTALTDPDNVLWVIERPDSAQEEDNAESTVASGAAEDVEDDDPDMPPFVLADHVPGMSFISRMDPELQRYWLTGPGAAKVRWGTEGSFRRCVSHLRKYFPQNPEGLCANLYHEAVGHWPGEKRGK